MPINAFLNTYYTTTPLINKSKIHDKIIAFDIFRETQDLYRNAEQLWKIFH